MPFIRTGQYVGVSIGYCLSGEATWPAPIHDCKVAVSGDVPGLGGELGP